MNLDDRGKCRRRPATQAAALEMRGQPQRLGAYRGNEGVKARADLRDVPHRVDTRVGGSQVLIDDDAARGLEARALRQPDAWRKTGRDDDAIVRMRELLEVLSVAHLDPARREMLVQSLGPALGELQLDQARLAVKDCHRVPCLVEVRRDLAADQPSSDDSPAGRSGLLEELCAALA